MVRARVSLVLLALLCVPLLVLSIEVASAPRTSDFGCFWASGRVVLDGADPYDPQEWERRHAGTYRDAFGVERAPFCGPRWPYPLWTALFFAPLAALPLGPAAWIWQMLLLAGAAGGVALIARATAGSAQDRRRLALIAAAAQPLWMTVMVAQLGGVLVLLLGALAIVAVRSRASAAIAMAILVKPHVLGLAAGLRVLAGGRRTLGTAALLGAAVLAICELVQPRWWAGWAAELLGYRARVAASEATSLSNLSAIAFGDARWAVVPVVVTLLALLWARGRRPIDDLAAATTLSLVATPYAGSHDQLALLLPWAVILGVARQRGEAWGERVAITLIACAVVLPWVLYATRASFGGHEAANALVPLATAGLLVVTQRGARETSTPPFTKRISWGWSRYAGRRALRKGASADETRPFRSSNPERRRPMNLNSVLIGSEDPKRLVDYYTKLFGKPATEDAAYTGWQIGTGWLTVGPHDQVSGKSAHPGRIIWNIESTDVRGDFTKLKAAGATVVREPYNPGGPVDFLIATLSDPDDNYFQLMSQM